LRVDGDVNIDCESGLATVVGNCTNVNDGPMLIFQFGFAPCRFDAPMGLSEEQTIPLASLSCRPSFLSGNHAALHSGDGTATELNPADHRWQSR
jgi:hypothetical protein